MFKETEESESEDSPVMNTTICISIETVKEIVEVAYKNRDSLHTQQPSFYKYLNRIQEFVKSKEGKDIFNPAKERFTLICEDIKKELPEDTKQTDKNIKANEAHYVKLQDYRLLNDRKPIAHTETWQTIFYELFPYLNFNEYYRMILHSHKQLTTSPLAAILNDIEEVPETFCTPQENQVHIDFLIGVLKNYLNKHDVAHEEIVKYVKVHEEEIEQIKSAEEVIIKLMRDMMRTTGVYHRKAKAANAQLKMDIIPLLLAGHIMEMKSNFPFFIEKVSMKELEERARKREGETTPKSKPLPHSKQADFILKLESGTGKPKIDMKSILAPKATGWKKKAITFKGDSIQEFIRYFLSIKNVDKLIADNDNSTGQLYLYSDFVRALFSTINANPALSGCSEEQKKNVALYIEKYVLYRLYKQ
eukprot:TRINITY_DN2079_c0_g6_i1.p1 TRINITY_DN2079_c0_g6~~TRINITY_DN2079_c0_g6_i1.p1  ORF type:complete len:418 (-),score=118.79 TRINITY_DN2079_c0_g6_i1:723-1976(-)